jgi:hypothetical protein
MKEGSIMKKLAIVTALLGVLTTPASAMEWTPENYAKLVANLALYDANCGGLSPNMKHWAEQLSELADPKQVGPATLNVLSIINEVGWDRWCSFQQSNFDPARVSAGARP